MNLRKRMLTRILNTRREASTMLIDAIEQAMAAEREDLAEKELDPQERKEKEEKVPWLTTGSVLHHDYLSLKQMDQFHATYREQLNELRMRMENIELEHKIMILKDVLTLLVGWGFR